MLSKKTKYGLRALIYLARQEKGKPIQISEISKAEHISRKFLENILLILRKNGFLESKQGKYGGYSLSKSPKDIKITTIMRVLEGPIAMVPCVSLNYYETCDDCKDEKTCSINNLMVEVRDSMLSVFNNKTLEDLM